MKEVLDRPVCIATVYSEDEFLVTRSFLEAYSIVGGERGNPGNYRGVHLPKGLGSLAILVPQSQAEMAFDLLAETEETPDALDSEAAPQPVETVAASNSVLSRVIGSVSRLLAGQREGKSHEATQQRDPERILHDPRQSEAHEPLSGN